MENLMGAATSPHLPVRHTLVHRRTCHVAGSQYLDGRLAGARGGGLPRHGRAPRDQDAAAPVNQGLPNDHMVQQRCRVVLVSYPVLDPRFGPAER